MPDIPSRPSATLDTRGPPLPSGTISMGSSISSAARLLTHRRGYGRGISRLTLRCIDSLPANVREGDRRACDLRRGAIERVPVENDQVSELTDLDGPGLVQMVHICGTSRVRGERLTEAEALA